LKGRPPLLVCHCLKVCDRIVRECVREGARSADEVGNACGAGRACGGCRSSIDAIVTGELARPNDSTPMWARSARQQKGA
jgi:bacterioferritin-associated ferredoxin